MKACLVVVGFQPWWLRPPTRKPDNLFVISYWYLPPRMCLLILERGEGMEKEGKKHQCERETSISCFYALHQGPNPQPRHVHWNRTRDLSAYRTMLQPTEPHWPGLATVILRFKISWGWWFGSVDALLSICLDWNNCRTDSHASVAFIFYICKTRCTHAEGM